MCLAEWQEQAERLSACWYKFKDLFWRHTKRWNLWHLNLKWPELYFYLFIALRAPGYKVDNLQWMVPFDLHHISFSILKLLYIRHNHSGTHSPLPLFRKFFTSVQRSLHHISLLRPTPIAVRSNEKVGGRSTAGIAARISLRTRMFVPSVLCVWMNTLCRGLDN